MEAKKIVVLSGSPRKKDGYRIVNSIKDIMSKDGNVIFEYINVNKLEVNNCTGCMQCFRKGEDCCPYKDDVSSIAQKLIEADGIIFLSPVYALGITGGLKQLVDRLAYMFHRPALIAKPAITVVTTGGNGIKPTQDYLKLIARGFGCHLVGELSVQSTFYFEGKYQNASYAAKTRSRLHKLAKRFGNAIGSERQPKPTFHDIYVFHGLRSKAYLSEADHVYWTQKGWMDSQYYYKTSLGPLKWCYGRALNGFINMMVKHYIGDAA